MAVFESAFSDGASLVLRAMLADPHRAWVVRDFVAKLGVSRGWAADILSLLRRRGYLRGKNRGRDASSTLRNAEELMREWVKHYDVEWNETHLYYSPDPVILPKIKDLFKNWGLEKSYGLTLHSGANLITNFIRDANAYLYLETDKFDELSLELRKALDLKELKTGGNIYLMAPAYKKSAFFGLRKIKGFSVVSNLQLFLDLYRFPQRGQEHAEYLLRRLKEEGQKFD